MKTEVKRVGEKTSVQFWNGILQQRQNYDEALSHQFLNSGNYIEMIRSITSLEWSKSHSTPEISTTPLFFIVGGARIY